MPLTRARRSALVAVATLGAIAGSFTAGVMAGAGSAAPPPASLLDEAAGRIEDGALHPVDRTALDQAAIEGMLRAVGDPWGQWQPTAEAPAQAGVGLWLRGGDTAPVVARVTPDSPAEDAEVRAGDEVRAVDGRSTAGIAPPTVAQWLRGADGTPVEVQLARGTSLRTVELRRSGLAPGAVAVRTLADQPSGPVAVVTVPAFERGAGRQVREALTRTAPGAGVVLDLRGNAGGLLDEAVEVASAFLDGGPVVRATRRDGTVQQYDAVGTGDATTPLAVLVDGGSASAAEVVAGVLQERGRGVLVGARTYGKGSVQEPRTLSDGSSLQLTVAAYTTPAGRSIEGVGLTPDIEVAPGTPPATAVQRAADVLPGLRADGTGSTG